MRTAFSSLVLAVLATAAGPACAMDHTIHVGGAGLVFTPSNIEALVGDTVTFVNDGGFHNVASDAGSPLSFRCANGCDGSGGNGNVSNASWNATITITAAAAHGSIGFHCEAHEASGMVGSISVTNPVDLQSFSID
ncbi:cupredoxin domain-containing protein [Dokdonella sp.]|jgi:plastocyanin|uniref:cupredoxin domain-containing protein n=1 Tax=Dokdonella sp. TaxID=2291710 RepID=UPI002F40937B